MHKSYIETNCPAISAIIKGRWKSLNRFEEAYGLSSFLTGIVATEILRRTGSPELHDECCFLHAIIQKMEWDNE